MIIEYDRKAEAFYIQFIEAYVDDNIDIEDKVTVDVDEKGHIVSLGILDASKRSSIKETVNIYIQNLSVEDI
ncbi:MAG TPA: DUF2283 domain-containing protein [Syntrophorhabdaceae bacterium]|nr:DUF2283 domain-containing protein [Syntrophorhabdaceae bacterium]